MIKDRIQNPSKIVELKKCPGCNKSDHNWQQVYTENNSILDKMANTYIAMCKQQNDYVLITKNDT